MVNSKTNDTFQLRISLLDVEPEVWRRVVVPGQARLSKLAKVLLASMGWSGDHLHQFVIGSTFYGTGEDSTKTTSTKRVKVADALRGQRTFVFDYDFGDSWQHHVDIEVGVPELGSQGKVVACCLDGANACPPEDVGGPDGYRNFLDAIRDPAHAEHEEFVEGIGGSFDPTSFDIDVANSRIRKLR